MTEEKGEQVLTFDRAKIELDKLVGNEKMKKQKATALMTFKLSMGNISVSCEKANMSRETFYRWKRTDEYFKTYVDDVGESVIDLVETALFRKIKDGSTAEIIFFLKTRGKNRGYVERVESVVKNVEEFENKSVEEIQMEIDLLDEELKRLDEAID